MEMSTEKQTDAFIKEMDAFQLYIAAWSKSKGFWDFTTPVPGADGQMVVNRRMPVDHSTIKGTKLMLVVSELGECLEAIRKGDLENEVEELADAVIRLMDYAGTYQMALGEMIVKKMLKNEGRPYKHGKAF